MRICPFWSSERKVIECSKECPMNNFYTAEETEEDCPFQEYLEEDNIKAKGICESEFA